jgi:regulator of ribonuclease activity A
MKNTCDICDEYPHEIQIAESNFFKDFGAIKSFSGEIVTLKCFESNPIVRAELEKDGTGKVLVVDGGHSFRCALLGDNIGELAVKNNWNGIVLNACVRDSAALSKLQIGIKAIGIFPLKSFKRNDGERNVNVNFAGVNFVPGNFIYCDEDGVLTSEKKY